MKMAHPSEFISIVIEMDKDFDAEWIKEMIVSRILISDFSAKIEELMPHVSSNDPNGAKYAIKVMEGYLCDFC